MITPPGGPFCPNCGQAAPAGATYCASCGAVVSASMAGAKRRRQWVVAGVIMALTPLVAVVVLTAAMGDLFAWTDREPDHAPYLVIADETIRMQPNSNAYYFFNVTKTSNLGYNVEPNWAEVLYCVIPSNQTSRWHHGEPTDGEACQHERSDPSHVIGGGGGGLRPGSYAFAIRCMEVTKGCTVTVDVGLYHCPDQGCFSDAPN